MNLEKISIVLVEDHKIVRKGLKNLLELESDFFVIGEADNGIDAIELIEVMKPTLVIMDIALPILNGIQASAQLLKTNPSIKILILSAYADDGYIEKLTEIGVAGYIAKQCSPDILIEAVREIVKGNDYFSATISSRMKNIAAFKISNNGKFLIKRKLLSDRELQVLQLIAEGQANKEVAYVLNISIKTVEKHRQNVMKKLSIHDTAGLTRYAIAEGIIESSKQKSIIN